MTGRAPCRAIQVRWLATSWMVALVALATPGTGQTVLEDTFVASLGEWQGYGTTRASWDGQSWPSGALRIDGDGTAFVNVSIPPEMAGQLRVVGRLRTSGEASTRLRLRGSCFEEAGVSVGATPSGWASNTLSSLLPPGTGRVELQLVSSGSGTSWLDDVTVRVVGMDSLPAPSGDAARYLEAAVDSIQAHVLYTESVDWPDVRAAARRRARGATKPCETWPAIEAVLADIGQPHGWLATPAQAAWYDGNDLGGDAAVVIRADTFPDRTGYVLVPGVPTTDSSAVARVATSIQWAILSHSEAGVCRWVVDLRDNGGGNMWPMLTGLGWILGDGDVGSFVAPGSIARLWSYRDGESRLGGRLQLRGSPRPPGVPAKPPVAVLYGPRTASSGEAVAVSFRGRAFSRSFGRPTAGLTTSTSSFDLSDGSRLTFATTLFADRDGVLYGGTLEPDVLVSSPRDGEPSDPTLDAALDWLRRVPCATR